MISTMTQVCRLCKEELPIEKFYLLSHESGKRRPECIRCVREYQKSIYNPEKRKSQHLRYLYNITIDQYSDKLEDQGNLCAICGTDTPGGNGKKFYVDHNHATGQVRGLLCHNCNFLIGHCKENKEILMWAIMYLENWEGNK